MYKNYTHFTRQELVERRAELDSEFKSLDKWFDCTMLKHFLTAVVGLGSIAGVSYMLQSSDICTTGAIAVGFTVQCVKFGYDLVQYGNKKQLLNQDYTEVNREVINDIQKLATQAYVARHEQEAITYKKQFAQSLAAMMADREQNHTPDLVILKKLLSYKITGDLVTYLAEAKIRGHMFKSCIKELQIWNQKLESKALLSKNLKAAQETVYADTSYIQLCKNHLYSGKCDNACISLLERNRFKLKLSSYNELNSESPDSNVFYDKKQLKIVGFIESISIENLRYIIKNFQFDVTVSPEKAPVPLSGILPQTEDAYYIPLSWYIELFFRGLVAINGVRWDTAKNAFIIMVALGHENVQETEGDYTDLQEPDDFLGVCCSLFIV